MEPNKILEALGPWRTRVLRPAWMPVVELDDGPPTASKFCGTPWTGPGAPWPVCATCDTPMGLLLQLRLDDIPVDDGRYGAGLLQLFYCARSDFRCEAEDAYIPFADKATRVRIIDPIPTGEADPAPPTFQPTDAPPQRIVGWDRIDDRPDFHDFHENGFFDDDVPGTDRFRLRCPEVGLDIEIPYNTHLLYEISQAAMGDKLGGWPKWIQRREPPSCPRCGREMGLVFQVSSGDHARDAFAEFGTGHISQCPEHKDVVAFDSAR